MEPIEFLISNGKFGKNSLQIQLQLYIEKSKVNRRVFKLLPEEQFSPLNENFRYSLRDLGKRFGPGLRDRLFPFIYIHSYPELDLTTWRTFTTIPEKGTR